MPGIYGFLLRNSKIMKEIKRLIFFFHLSDTSHWLVYYILRKEI